MKAQRFDMNIMDFVPYEIPEGYKSVTYETNMKQLINCASCGRQMRYGDSYRSWRYVDCYHVPYSICNECRLGEQESREYIRQYPDVAHRICNYEEAVYKLRITMLTPREHTRYYQLRSDFEQGIISDFKMKHTIHISEGYKDPITGEHVPEDKVAVSFSYKSAGDVRYTVEIFSEVLKVSTEELCNTIHKLENKCYNVISYI